MLWVSPLRKQESDFWVPLQSESGGGSTMPWKHAQNQDSHQNGGTLPLAFGEEQVTTGVEDLTSVCVDCVTEVQ